MPVDEETMVKPVSADHLFPRFHVRPPLGYLNDPNGPLLLDGTFHLYYQYRHSTDHAAPVVWGHATSADLAHWVHQRPAIVPHPVLGDRDGCWSGNTVVDDAGRVRAFYSGKRNGHPYQSVLCAVSGDGGASFGDPRQVVDDPDPSEGIITFRDPFVWRDQDRWLMVVGAGDASLIASARLYGSDDLDRWQHLGVLAAQRRTVDAEQDTGEMWECPQVIQLAGHPVVLVGAWTRQHGTSKVYSVAGGSTTGRAGPLTIAPLDDGPDFYAASVLRDSHDGTLVWGWATEARDHTWCVEDGWSGSLTLPRVVRPRSGDRLALAPVPALALLRDGEPVTVGPQGQDGLAAQLEFEATAAPDVPLRVRLRFGDHERLDVVLDRAAGAVWIDRNRASLDERAIGGTIEIAEAFAEDETAGARAFLDGSILEVFTSSGRVATVRYYPTAPPPYRIEITGGPPGSVRLWQLSADQALATDRL